MYVIHSPRLSLRKMANGPRKQLFPGYSYADPSRFAGGCELLGITLKEGKHLGNLGMSICVTTEKGLSHGIL